MKTLDEHAIHHDPLEQFKRWLDEAIAENFRMPNAMTLATVSRDGKPSARIVLLKQVDERGFIFYTNYLSRKGKELSANPFASLTFFWDTLDRQVRAEGSVIKVSEEESNQYFQSRPRDSQISAVISSQSSIVESREELENKWQELEQALTNKPIPRPQHWGGYCLKPASIEFWQGRESRLHDRILYELQNDGSWKISRLAP